MLASTCSGSKHAPWLASGARVWVSLAMARIAPIQAKPKWRFSAPTHRNFHLPCFPLVCCFFVPLLNCRSLWVVQVQVPSTQTEQEHDAQAASERRESPCGVLFVLTNPASFICRHLRRLVSVPIGRYRPSRMRACLQGKSRPISGRLAQLPAPFSFTRQNPA